MHGPLALAHNGNIVNTPALRDELLARGFGLTATSDSEVMTLMLAAAGGTTWEERIERTLPAWKGAFSLVLLAADRVLAVRDPWGFRPLSVGRLPHGGHAVASETCALSTLGCVEITEVQPGEIVTLQGAELHRRQALAAGRPTRPAARSSSSTSPAPTRSWDGRNVHHVRERLGAELAAESPADADVVIPVPDSSIPAAIGYARASGVPFNDGLIKNRYIGRTFIEPTQEIRDRGVALKFNALAENLAGKRVVMIDDSLVRGTTAGPLVKLIRDAGATEVHVRITCPPIMHPCHFGVDMGHDGDLMAARLTRRRDPRAGRRRQPRVPVAGGDDARRRQRRRRRGRLLQRLLHRALPARGRRGPGQAAASRACSPDARRRHRRAAGGSRRSPGPAGATATTSTLVAGARRRRPPATSTSSSPGPEAALVAGVADRCAARGVPCFGPTAALARLESSKGFARELATSLGIPGPAFARFDGRRRRRRAGVVAGSSAGRSSSSSTGWPPARA